jgi:hypothetical protein
LSCQQDNGKQGVIEMGAIAAGKVNASEATEGMRIIVKVSADGTVTPSRTKTGEGVQVARIIEKGFRAAGRYEARGKYVIHTSAGSFDAAPIQTMFLAPEDPAGIKRAMAEAVAEDAERAELAAQTEEIEEAAPEAAPAPADLVAQMDEAHEATTDRCPNEWHRSAPARRRMLCPECPSPFTLTEAEIEENAAQSERENLAEAEAARTENEGPEGIYAEGLTLNSHAGKVDHNSKDEPEGDEMTGTDETQTVTRETTGSAVVKLLERVHERIRQNHPEVPSVVIVTGSGADLMGQKWGHFRPRGWMTRVAEEGAATHLDEMFMAGETLAKGARQVLQTMLHESAHALAEKRGEKDTSRQGRWHNRTFVKTAEELGLEYKHGQADKSIGFSAVTLTEDTLAEYADLLDELDREIHLTVRLPFWLGGAAGGEDGDEDGGEQMGRKPRGGGAEGGSSSNNTKLTCTCDEPNIIRASKKVAAKLVVRCDDCESLFEAR